MAGSCLTNSKMGLWRMIAQFQHAAQGSNQAATARDGLPGLQRRQHGFRAGIIGIIQDQERASLDQPLPVAGIFELGCTLGSH